MGCDLRGTDAYSARRLHQHRWQTVLEEKRRQHDLAQLPHLRRLAGKTHAHPSAGRLRQRRLMLGPERLIQIVGELGRTPVGQRGEQRVRRSAKAQPHIRISAGPQRNRGVQPLVRCGQDHQLEKCAEADQRLTRLRVDDRQQSTTIDSNADAVVGQLDQPRLTIVRAGRERRLGQSDKPRVGNMDRWPMPCGQSHGRALVAAGEQCRAGASPTAQQRPAGLRRR